MGENGKYAFDSQQEHAAVRRAQGNERQYIRSRNGGCEFSMECPEGLRQTAPSSEEAAWTEWCHEGPISARRQAPGVQALKGFQVLPRRSQ